MAEQSTSQQDDLQTVNVILANVGTVICFRTGNPADEKLLLPLFAPYLDEGEISKLSSYNFYMRMAAATTQPPLSGMTIVYEGEEDEEVAQKVIEASRTQYAKRYKPRETSKKKAKPNDEGKGKRERKGKNTNSADTSPSPAEDLPIGQ